jgi:hypothetical protein
MVVLEECQDYLTLGKVGLQIDRTIHYTGEGWFQGLYIGPLSQYLTPPSLPYIITGASQTK